jgi:hypothetical protein
MLYIPLRPSLLFFDGMVRSRVPSPGVLISNTSIASRNPQYNLCYAYGGYRSIDQFLCFQGSGTENYESRIHYTFDLLS